MDLGIRLVDHVLRPIPTCPFALLFQPIEAVAVSLAIDDVGLAIIVHVVADDGKAGIVQLPVCVPFPLIVVGIDIFEPTVWGQNIGLPIAIYVSCADAMTILLFSSDMVHLRLWTR